MLLRALARLQIGAEVTRALDDTVILWQSLRLETL